jgi:NodT family efflux transporter outer membrane factor (OMF) lipoprotein
LEIARNQYGAGVAAQSDVITAETQLENARAQAISFGVQRAALEHAIAVLIGKAPAELTLPPAELTTSVPVTPPGLPSTLLERRPDIAASERAVASANAQIGVAESAYFPDLTLTGSLSFASTELGNLFSVANSAWSIGAQVAETVFEGGLRGAQVEAARAAYDESVANYRQTVLAALQQVEDQLSNLRVLEQQAEVQARALALARQAVQLTLNQYQAGTVAYTNVVVAQTTALGDEQTVLTILGNRLTASVTLVESLGGGWDRAQLPTLAEAAP